MSPLTNVKSFPIKTVSPLNTPNRMLRFNPQLINLVQFIHIYVRQKAKAIIVAPAKIYVCKYKRKYRQIMHR